MAVNLPLGGAAQRLLHPVVPGALFGFAVLAHIAAWLLLGWAAPEVIAGQGGPGPALAAVHAVAVGVLLPTVAAAVMQILPVATLQGAPPAWVGLIVFGALAGGAVLLIGGFATVSLPLVQGGALALAAGLGLFLVVAARLTWGARRAGPIDTVMAVGGALVLLMLAVGLAVMLATGYALPDHAAAAGAHAAGALFGGIGLLVMGFSGILLPMLAVAEPPRPGSARPAIAAAFLGALLAMGGSLAGVPVLVGAGIVAGLVAAGLHIWLMQGALAKRMRRRLGREFHLIRLSWGLLVLALLVALGIVAGVLPERLEGLVVVLALHGWVLSLLTGVLQRILPFLASMHTVRACAKAAVVTRLGWAPPLTVHAVCHAGAVLLVAAGIVVEVPLLVQGGAVIGAAGAVAFVVFAVSVVALTLRHARTVGPKSSPVSVSVGES
jgi:hypothetical protein